ncbi:MAG: hypothetical protein ACRDD1_02465 [Planctomycetia bacterium]
MKDVTLGEDGGRVRKGSAPQVLAALRNTAVHVLKRLNGNVRAAVETAAADLPAAFRMLFNAKLKL